MTSPRLATLGILALLACAPAPGPSAPRPGGPPRVRIATWNVHDLFDAEDQRWPPGAADEVLTPGEAEAKLAAVAEGLLALDADAVLLEEVENAGVLAALAARAGYPEARLVEGNDPRGIDVALLSRLPVRRYESHRDARGPDGSLLWSRDAVVAELDAGGAGPPLVLVGSHLVSRLSDDGTRRAAQAAGLRALADAEAARGAAVLAGGDLNDGAGDPGLAPLLGDGAWRSLAPGPPSWTDGARSARLDHWAAPADGLGGVAAAWVEEGAPWASASDHRPVVVELALPQGAGGVVAASAAASASAPATLARSAGEGGSPP
ncbi:MAG: endonuclease/exonuclease/phosphatase family protein [Anaeromyxobacteraceae bacterium]